MLFVSADINIVKYCASFDFLPTTYFVKKIVRNALQICLILTTKLSNPYKGDCYVFMHIKCLVTHIQFLLKFELSGNYNKF